MYKKRCKTRTLERHVIAVELPLRMRAANLGGIAAPKRKVECTQSICDQSRLTTRGTDVGGDAKG